RGAADGGVEQRDAVGVDERAQRALRPAGEHRVPGGRTGAAVGRRRHQVVPVVVPDDVAALVPVVDRDLHRLGGGPQPVRGQLAGPDAAVVAAEVQVLGAVDVGEAGRVDGAQEATV